VRTPVSIAVELAALAASEEARRTESGFASPNLELNWTRHLLKRSSSENRSKAKTNPQGLGPAQRFSPSCPGCQSCQAVGQRIRPKPIRAKEECWITDEALLKTNPRKKIPPNEYAIARVANQFVALRATYMQG